MNTRYQEYAHIKAEIKALEARAKVLEIEIVEELSDMEGNKLKTDFATFSTFSSKKWQYSDLLLEKEKLIKDKVKVMKKEEELNGTAVLLQDSLTLRCQLVK